MFESANTGVIDYITNESEPREMRIIDVAVKNNLPDELDLS
jgi:hypothetical protein